MTKPLIPVHFATLEQLFGPDAWKTFQPKGAVIATAQDYPTEALFETIARQAKELGATVVANGQYFQSRRNEHYTLCTFVGQAYQQDVK